MTLYTLAQNSQHYNTTQIWNLKLNPKSDEPGKLHKAYYTMVLTYGAHAIIHLYTWNIWLLFLVSQLNTRSVSLRGIAVDQSINYKFWKGYSNFWTWVYVRSIVLSIIIVYWCVRLTECMPSTQPQQHHNTWFMACPVGNKWGNNYCSRKYYDLFIIKRDTSTCNGELLCYILHSSVFSIIF